MKLLMVDSISRGGYFNFRNINLKLLHSSAKISGEDERQCARIKITYCQRDFDNKRPLLLVFLWTRVAS